MFYLLNPVFVHLHLARVITIGLSLSCLLRASRPQPLWEQLQAPTAFPPAPRVHNKQPIWRRMRVVEIRIGQRVTKGMLRAPHQPSFSIHPYH